MTSIEDIVCDGRRGAPVAALSCPMHLVCSVCQSPQEDPRMLQCYHSFCSMCLASSGGGLVAESHSGGHDEQLYAPFKPPSLTCPICAFVTTTASIDMLPVNYAAQAELRQLRQLASCRNCGEHDADAFCPECNCLLCMDCNKRIHMHRIFQTHRPITLAQDSDEGSSVACTPTPEGERPTLQSPSGKGQASSGRSGLQHTTHVLPDAALRVGSSEWKIPVPCARHNHEFRTTFCRSCSVSVCPRCVEEAHDGHPIGTFQMPLEHAAQHTPELEATLSEVVEQCDTAKAVVEAGKRDLAHHRDACLESIKLHTASLMQLIERRSRDLESEVKTEYVRKSQLLSQQLATLAQRREAALRSLWLVSTLTCKAEEHVSQQANIAAAEERITADRPVAKPLLVLQPPSNTSPSVVADVTAMMSSFIAYAQSQRIDCAACVETSLRMSFTGQEEPLERLIQHFGSFYSKRSRERKFPPPSIRAAARLTNSREAGLASPGGSRSMTPRLQTQAPWAGPLGSPSAPGDTSGLMYFFGCDGGIKPYQNPCLRGSVEVRASSVGYGKLEHLVHYVAIKRAAAASKSPVRPSSAEGLAPSRPGTAASSTGAGVTPVGKDFCTQNVPFSWVLLKLTAAVELEAYSLFHDTFESSSHFIRSWELRGRAVDPHHCYSELDFRTHYDYSGPLYVELHEGKWARSNDQDALRHLDGLRSANTATAAAIGVDTSPKWWIVLDSRRNSDAIKPGAPSAIFFVTQSSPTAHAEQQTQEVATTVVACTQFALIQTGPNSSGNHHLMVSCLELYGTMLAE